MMGRVGPSESSVCLFEVTKDCVIGRSQFKVGDRFQAEVIYCLGGVWSIVFDDARVNVYDERLSNQNVILKGQA